MPCARNSSSVSQNGLPVCVRRERRSGVESEMLAHSRRQNPSRLVFANSIGGALDLDNVADRVIKPVLRANGLKWKGRHAYRRGLATNLHELGIPDKVIQAILRQEDVKTTQRSYIKTVSSVVTEAMKRLEEKIACAADVRQAGFGELIRKCLKEWSRRSDLNR